MSHLSQTLSLVAAVVLAYVWLQTPWLTMYSLQIFAVCIAGYFVLKRIHKAAVWHIAPRPASLELGLITFALLLLIGSTGDLQSYFFPLSYAHLFFLVLACPLSSILVATAALLLFHLGLTATMSPPVIATWLSLPLLMVFFLFAKHQYDQSQADQQLLVVKNASLSQVLDKQTELLRFVAEYCQPKVLYLQELAKFPEPNRHQLQHQLTSLNLEVSKIIKKFTS